MSIVPCLFVLMLSGPIAASGEAVVERVDDERLAAEVESRATTIIEKKLALGMVVGVLDGDRRFVRSFGLAKHGGEAPPDADTVYEIGSVTKAFTGILLADAIERGEMNAEDPIAKYLPDEAAIDEEEGVILLRHLTTHTSGLPRIPSNMRNLDPRDPYQRYGDDLLHEFLSTCVLDDTPGERYSYSNLGVGLLGQLIARNAGFANYEELLVERVSKPLGLHDTRLAKSSYPDERRAAPSGPNNAPSTEWEFDALAGCGAIRSTLNDMLTFAKANLEPDSTPLAGAIRRSHEVLHPFKGGKSGVAYGWHVDGDGRTVWHNGQTGGYHSYVGIDPVHRVAVVILSSSTAGDVDAMGIALREFLVTRPE